MKLNLLQMAAKQTFSNNMFLLGFGKYFQGIQNGFIESKNGRIEIRFPEYGGLKIEVFKPNGRKDLWKFHSNFFNSELQYALKRIHEQGLLDLENEIKPYFTRVPKMPYFTEAMPHKSKFTKQELKQAFCILIFFFASFFLLIKILKLCM